MWTRGKHGVAKYSECGLVPATASSAILITLAMFIVSSYCSSRALGSCRLVKLTWLPAPWRCPRYRGLHTEDNQEFAKHVLDSYWIFPYRLKNLISWALLEVFHQFYCMFYIRYLKVFVRSWNWELVMRQAQTTSNKKSS